VARRHGQGLELALLGSFSRRKAQVPIRFGQPVALLQQSLHSRLTALGTSQQTARQFLRLHGAQVGVLPELTLMRCVRLSERPEKVVHIQPCLLHHRQALIR
jgi:hypothetical protein